MDVSMPVMNGDEATYALKTASSGELRAAIRGTHPDPMSGA